MPEFFGSCGRFAPTPCKLVWSSHYPNKIGTYPADFLPSRRTIWHATSDGGYNFSAPLFGIGDLGTPIAGLLGGFFVPPQFDTFTPQAHIALIFAQTVNRLNASHILTQAEVQSAQSNNGIALIDVGEYVFEAIAVTDQIQDVEIVFTPEELQQISSSGEAESDRAFRKLFENLIPETRSRLLGIETNKVGIEYRFDNGGPKMRSALQQAGGADLESASYRDGSSRILKIDLNKIITDRVPRPPGSPSPAANSLQAVVRQPHAGDTIYLTYVAVKEHYIRQSVEIPYTITALSLPPQAFGSAGQPKVASYRFYEWLLQPETPQGLPIKVAGWRIVESHNIPVNFIATVGKIGAADIGQFIINGTQSGLITVAVMNTVGGIKPSEVLGFRDNRTGSSRSDLFAINMNQVLGTGRYHIQSDTTYKSTSWYLRKNYTTHTKYESAKQHVFFNVHNLALQKRDVDKFGIEASLAREIESDIKQGLDTFVPFMDSSDFVTPYVNVKTYLDASNTKFQPIFPVSTYTSANIEIEVGVAGSIQLGNTGSTDDIIAVFGFNSNIISERFAEQTRIWAERHFLVGSRGARIIAIEGAGGGRTSISCIGDPSREYAFTIGTNLDNFVTINDFSNPLVHVQMSDLVYRPDLGSLNSEGDLKPSNFPESLGYSGMLGDSPGFVPGRAISVSQISALDSFKYITTSRSALKRRYLAIEDKQIFETIVQELPDRKIINIGDGYNGRTEIEYSYDGRNSIEVMLIFKDATTVESSVDSIRFSQTYGKNSILQVAHQYLKGNVLEIVGNIQDVKIKNVTVQQIVDNKANDFLNEETSSTDVDIDNIQQSSYNRSILFESDVISVGEDAQSRLFVFFNDKNGGISCVQSNDFGKEWYFHYGIVEPIEDNKAEHPFLVHGFEINAEFLFYLFRGKIMCKFVPYEMFVSNDSMLIEKYIDRVDASKETIRELTGLFSEDGKSLRREILSFAAAGDLTDIEFLTLCGKNPENNKTEAFENREVETKNSDGTVKVAKQEVRKFPITIGSGTAFTNKDIESVYFSAYRTDNGILKLFFLGPTDETAGGGNQLQCNFSVDNGASWYDYWEWIEYNYNRSRIDTTKNIQWIDRTANGDPVDINNFITSAPDISGQQSIFGINVHWSRLKRHKIEGGDNLLSESEVLSIDAPYLFYQPSTKQVFLFYFYEGCLLCKMFGDSVFSFAATFRDLISGMQAVKNSIEKGIRSHFIDGDLSSNEIREEIHYYTNPETKEKMIEGNIIFEHQHAINTFNEDRRLSAHRICAYELPGGMVRVFYRDDKQKKLHSAIWNGSHWLIDDLMRTTSEPDLQIPPVESTTNVCGGFSGNNFERCS